MNAGMGIVARGQGEGALQRLDARARLIMALGFAFVVLSLQRPLALGAAVMLAVMLIALAKFDKRVLVQRLLPLELLLGLLAISLVLSVPGEPWLTLGTLQLSMPGLQQAIALLLRVHAIVIALLALLGGLEPARLAHALAALRLPERLVTLLLLTLRQIDLLGLEYRRLRAAMRSRAFVPKANLHSWRSLGWLMGMLLVRALGRARRLDAAMRCRGFRGRFVRFDPPPWHPGEILAGVIFGVVLIALLWLDGLGSI
jgi:cobalt/nickel transport system permease protein